MSQEYHDDLDGQVLRSIAEDGNDMTKPMEVEFHVAAQSEEVADAIADAAEQLGYEPHVFFDDGEDAEEDEEIIDQWTCTCVKVMLLQYDAIMAAQAELDELAKPLGGYADGWGTFSNVEK